MSWMYTRVWLLGATALFVIVALLTFHDVPLVLMVTLYLVAAFVAVAAVVVVLALPDAGGFVVRRLSRRSRPARPGARRRPAARIEALPDPTRFSTAELVQAWRSSHVSLRRARTVGEKVQVAARRQRYIDEFERRDRQGFERWLASGAQAGSDPAAFVSGLGSGSRRPDAPTG